MDAVRCAVRRLPAGPGRRARGRNQQFQGRHRPATGKLRPLTDAESAALDQQAASSARSSAARTTVPQTEAAARATERRLPNGTVARKLPATQMSSLAATRQADGRIVIEHSDDADTQPAHAEHGALPHE